MSIETAVANILAEAKSLSAAAIPIMEGWLLEQSKGVALHICHNDLSAWFSGLRPEQVQSEQGWVVAQIKYLAWLLPEIQLTKEGTYE